MSRHYLDDDGDIIRVCVLFAGERFDGPTYPGRPQWMLGVMWQRFPNGQATGFPYWTEKPYVSRDATGNEISGIDGPFASLDECRAYAARHSYIGRRCWGRD